MRAFKPPKGTSWVFNTFYVKFLCIQVQLFRSSGPETKKTIFFIFFIIMGKLYMQWQYDPQKAQLDHKLQIYAQIHNESTIVFAQWSRKESMTLCHPPTRPLARQTTHLPTHLPLNL